MNARFAIATRDELWSIGATPLLLVSRLAHGEALTGDGELVATDACDPELVAACDERLSAAHAAMAAVRDVRVRIVASARRAGDAAIRAEVALIVTRRGISIVSDTVALESDLLLLDDATAPPNAAADFDARLPIVWMNGSGAVLLHEAAGHAAEYGHAPVEWPSWLRVTDEPEPGLDDTGEPCRATNLLLEPPACHRRESFRDVPLQRMSNVIVQHEGAPFDFPEPRIEVHLVAGGLYDPLTQMVSLFITHAEHVTGSFTHRVRPFALHVARADVARGLRGAYGRPIRYPGVVCSREGQEIVVGCSAPLLLTELS